MAMEKRVLEITLDSIRVPLTGARLLKKSVHQLTAELIWPRVGVARKAAAQTCELSGGAADFTPLNWGRRILFRENVQGRFALGVTLSENLKGEELEKFFRFWAKAALGITVRAADQAAGPLGKAAAAPLDYLAREVAKYPGLALLSEGLVEMEAADFPLPGGTRLLTVRLLAARRLVRVTRRAATAQMPARTTRKTLLEKGADNGDVTLRITSL